LLTKHVGAKFYYLREVVHDWSEDKCVEILRNLIPALGRGSKILIDDLVLPEVGCSWQAAGADIAIMLIGGAERTLAEWEQLVVKAGLRILEVHAYDPQTYKAVMVIGRE
jgi:demethylsterigmatocystin 6-O-methyltransferase